MNELKRFKMMRGGDCIQEVYIANKVDAYIKERLPKDCECKITKYRTSAFTTFSNVLDDYYGVSMSLTCNYCGGKIVTPKEVSK